MLRPYCDLSVEPFEFRTLQIEISRREPVGSARVDVATRVGKFCNKFLSLRSVVCHVQRMAPGDITERSQIAHLHQQRAVRVFSESHTSFEQLRPRLTGKRPLKGGITAAEEFLQ